MAEGQAAERSDADHGLPLTWQWTPRRRRRPLVEDGPLSSVSDLVGIEHEGHPDRGRIPLPETWQSHPMSMDYDAERPQIAALGSLDTITGEVDR